MNKTEWKPIKFETYDYTGSYEVSSMGEVRNSRTNRILKPQRVGRGYYQVALSSNGIATRFLVHRLVAFVFIPILDINAEVNHINGDKSKNEVSNLEWLSQCDNMAHAFENGLHPNTKRPIIQLKDNEIINEFESLIDASRKTNIGVGSIHNSCSGRRKTAGGFVWKFK